MSLLFLDKFFKITERGSTVSTEVRAGVASFLTISYVILVNPQLLSLAGVPASSCVVATCLSSALGCFLCGVVGNLPFGLAPGMGLSAYLVYGLVLGGVMSVKHGESEEGRGFLPLLHKLTLTQTYSDHIHSLLNP